MKFMMRKCQRILYALASERAGGHVPVYVYVVLVRMSAFLYAILPTTTVFHTDRQTGRQTDKLKREHRKKERQLEKEKRQCNKKGFPNA